MAKEERKMRPALSVLLSWCLWAAASADEPVYFADPNLQAAVEGALCIPEPTATDMLGLTSLMSVEIKTLIVDLTGLEYATNLERLILRSNRIRDLSPLSGLTSLQELWVNVNDISDLSPLSGLTNLRELLLHNNRIGDLSPLSDMTRLEFLDFRNNQVTDLSALRGMTSLQYVDAYNNQITDLSPLLGLTSLGTLQLRENPLNDQAYVSHLQMIVDHNPGIDLSYSPNPRGPAGVTASAGTWPDRVRLAWEAVCKGPDYASYYQVSRALSREGARTRISGWQTSLSFDDVTAEPGTIYTYWVRTAASTQGNMPGDSSEPNLGWVPGPPRLTVSSGHGGAATVPDVGADAVQAGQIVRLCAEPVDANLYVFAGWTGPAVEAGLVADAHSASTTITMPAACCALVANFLSRMDVLYVDDDAPNDPGPADATTSDSREDGTREHPFDTIQEGIDFAAAGTTIVVRPGTYHECVEFRGRNIEVTGLDPSEALLPESFPVIDAGYLGTAVAFTRGEDANCVLTGFVITRGDGGNAGGIRCAESSPRITRCLIVGNRAPDIGRAAVYCRGSHATFVNCTVANPAAGERVTGIYLSDSQVVFVNSIISCDAPQNTNLPGPRRDSGGLSLSYTFTSDGAFGTGNIDGDPLFVRPGWWGDPKDPNVVVGPHASEAVWVAGDYHLKSQAGRWDPQAQAWVQDAVTSPCIDAADPNSPIGDELEPNGGRVNLGAYGGTAEASKSP
jgi:hypothetical protein